MKITNESPKLHICLGNQRDPHEAELREAANANSNVNWTISSKVAVGDSVAFYIKQPLSSFVATGVVVGNVRPNKDPQWPEKMEADIGQIKMIDVPLHYSEFKFGEYIFHPPQQSCVVQSEVESSFRKLLGIH